MHYAIRHVTRFTYDHPITESLMEVRMQPRTEGLQRCFRFELNVSPRARVLGYRDYGGNLVHHFDIPGRHSLLVLVSRASVEVQPHPVPPDHLDETSWARLDAATASGEHWDWLQPSRFATWIPQLRAFAEQIGTRRDTDPLALLARLTTRIHDHFDYTPNSTHVDSPIEEALANGSGVCQDFSHIMIAIVRLVGIPCRYVSGYLHHRAHGENGITDGATHAWVEAWLPELGWVGFDPTNDDPTGERHIRVAVGRDYADVPPTRGIFKGGARSHLSVAVDVTPADAPPPGEPTMVEPAWPDMDAASLDAAERERQRQQQQQQQQ